MMASSTVHVFRNLATVFNERYNEHTSWKKGEGRSRKLFYDLSEYIVFAKIAALFCLILMFILIKAY
jgi:hypothetical protein